MLSGLPAALWLLGLFAAAPALRTSRSYSLADRWRDALILGVAIPFALGAAHLLYPAACWCALALCLLLAYRRRFAEPSSETSPDARPPYLLIGALVAVAWPQLMRPLLDGDSLSYHLPNAASWVHAHSLWTTATRYWWYPPGSELFAAALYAVATPFALPWSGFCALTLLGFRIASWAREDGAHPLLADALASAAVTAYPLAIQGGTLQNDVWLAAFWLETLASLRAPMRATAMRAAAVTALIKPQGWLMSAIALLAYRAPACVWLAAAAAFGAWLVHDALLLPFAGVSAASVAARGALGSSIAAHGPAALALLARVAAQSSPFAAAALLAALFGPAIARDRRLGWAACAAALLFFALPFGYSTAVAQLATGASLRFAAPAIALGALILARPARRAPALAATLLLASTAFGIWYVLAIFWNDGSTQVALPIAAIGVVIAALGYARRTPWPSALAFGIAAIASVHLAARHPLDYYDDSLRVRGTPPGVYRWIERERPAALGGWGLRLGVVSVLSPQTQTLDLADANACAQARAAKALLVAVAENDRAAAFDAARLRAARACGRTVYADAIGVIADPAAP